LPRNKSVLLEGLEIKIPKAKLPKIKPIDKIILGEMRKEKKNVPQSVKTKAYARSKGKCEYPRCKTHLEKSEGEFHHWRDPPTERTTAFLCHRHHTKSHTPRTITDAFGNKRVRTVRKRIPLKK